MNVLLVGEESAGAQALKLLANSSHQLIGVMALPAKKAGGMMTLWQLAEKMGYRTWPAELVKDAQFAEVVIAEKVDLLLNIHSLFVIKGAIVEAPRFGSFNLHPGPLPRYAGLNAPSWAIYHDEKQHGVTLHKMFAGIDTGPIAYQTLFEIDDSDTGFSVSAKCIKAGLVMIKQLIDAASADPDSIPLIPQDLTKREYFGKGTPEDGWLAWSRPAREIYNFVRAADYSPFRSPWNIPRSNLGEHVIEFAKVSLTGRQCNVSPGTVGSSDGENAFVASFDEWIAVNKLIINNKVLNPVEILDPGDRLSWPSG